MYETYYREWEKPIMREIKYRAWHKIEKKMCKVDLIRPGHGAFLIGVSPDEDQVINNGKTIIVSSQDGRYCLNEEIDILEWTGMVDKNGCEIYEGDILLMDDGGEYFPEEYDNDKNEFYPIGKYEVYWKNSGWWLWSRIKDESLDFDAAPWWEEITREVVGNIYQ